MQPMLKLTESIRCVHCGNTPGGCACWRVCECGLTVQGGLPCPHPVHGPTGQKFLADGYWVVTSAGKPYRTRTHSLPWLRQRMDQNEAWATRNDAVAAMRRAFLAKREARHA